MAKQYVELPSKRPLTGTPLPDVICDSADKAPTDTGAAIPGLDDQGVGVVYQLDRIALELTQALHKRATPTATGENASVDEAHGANDWLPRALVLAQGMAAKRTFMAIAEAGIGTVAPLTGDWRLDVNPKFALSTVKLGNAAARALLSNAFALLRAADDGQVQAIFLSGPSLALAADNRFLRRAQAANMRVFAPLEMDSTRRHWIECEPDADDDAPQPTTWRTCHHCKLTFDNAEFSQAGFRCPSCGTLTRLDSHERIAQVLDADSFQEWDADVADADPLAFPGYGQKIAQHRARSGKNEAICTGRGTIAGIPAAVGFMEPSFFMGSMGSVVGEKVARLFNRATDSGLPVVIFCASGGARMQEGLASLMQMAKTACAVERHDQAGLLYVAVLCDPTTGGVTASFATLGDVILAEPGTQIGFAGKRVIRDTIKQELPEGFQTAEFALDHGLIDAIVTRESMRGALGRLLALHGGKGAEEPGKDATAAAAKATVAATASSTAFDGRLPKNWLQNPLERFPFVERLVRKDDDKPGEERSSDEILVSPRDKARLERHAKRELKRAGLSEQAAPGSAWESVQLARNVHRPTARTYIKGICQDFFELHGDRAFGDDGAIVAGLARVAGRPVTVIAQEKGADLSDRIRRNFGCPQPEGYRKTARLMRQAQKFARPILCLVDTQGAFCGTEAEERGQGNAIAENLQLMASLRVPVISVLLGEGGSGGALALALSNKVAMQEHAVYSVLSPEGFASILWKDGKRAPEAAEVMGMNAAEVLRLGVVDAVLSEGDEPAHVNPDQAVANVRTYVEDALNELCALTPDQLVAQRQQRFARF